MVEYPPELNRGVCDQLLSGVTSPNGSVVVVLAINLIRSGPRALVHVTDAGSNLFDNGSPLSIRLVMPDATQLQPGDMIKILKFSLNEIHSTKLVTVIQFERIGHWQGFSTMGKAIPHPHMGSGKTSSSSENKTGQNPANSNANIQTGMVNMSDNRNNDIHSANTNSNYYNSAVAVNNNNNNLSNNQNSNSGPISVSNNGINTNSVRSGPYTSNNNNALKGPISRNQDVPVYPIKNITSYLHRWKIIGRVVSKSDIRKFSSSKTKEGKVFSFEVCDADGSEIRATCFTKAVDKFYDFLKEGEVYSFSKGDVKEANARFNTTGHEFEIIFNEDAEIQSMPQDERIPRKAYNFVKISDIRTYSKGQTLDLIGILLKAGPITTITVKSTGAETQKRELTIIDQSGHSIDLTLWSERTQLDESMILSNPVIAVKNAIVEEFNGFRLKLGSSSSIEWNPVGIENSSNLRMWFNNNGGQAMLQNNLVSLSSNSPTSGSSNYSNSLSQRQTIEEIITLATSGGTSGVAGSSENIDNGIWVYAYGAIRSIRDSKYYWSSCPQCKRKVTEIEDQNSINSLVLPYSSEKTTANNPSGLNMGPNYHCPNCQQSIENPIKKYILSCDIVDSTGTLRAVAFAEHGETIMGGLPVEKLESLKENSDKNTEDVFSDRIFSEWVFKLNGKKELYQDSVTIKYRIFSAEDMSSPEVLNREAKKKIEYIYNKLNNSNDIMGGSGSVVEPSTTKSINSNSNGTTVKVGMGFAQFGY
ncbi:Rf-A (OB fold) [Cryptosporidium xiaoi]|uniref:Rf-A (OB fold) n=1 Tax=Cryptosporidium xiaoi TaxID=659607 RepID=A0AAV9XXR8_9CRYT